MEKESTKLTTREKILLESMKLFSVSGFEAVSIRTIASKVGVSDSALYKHFKSKQEILDMIVDESKERFYEQYKKVFTCNMENFNFPKICIDMFRFQTEDEWIVCFRQILILEQFKNKKMAEIYKELFIDMPIGNMTQIFKDNIDKGYLKDMNPRVMAMELYAPFFMYHTVNEDMDELEILFKKHVDNFMASYFV